MIMQGAAFRWRPLHWRAAVELVDFPSGAQSQQALVGGHADLAAGCFARRRRKQAYASRGTAFGPLSLSAFDDDRAIIAIE